MRTPQPVRCSDSERHRAEEAAERVCDHVRVVAKNEVESVAKKRCAIAVPFAHTDPEHLAELMIREKWMNATRKALNERCHLCNHAVREIDAIDEALAVNQLLDDEVVFIGFIEPSKGNDAIEVNRVVVQITGDDESPAIAEVMHAATTAWSTAQHGGCTLKQSANGVGIA